MAVSLHLHNKSPIDYVIKSDFPLMLLLMQAYLEAHMEIKLFISDIN